MTNKILNNFHRTNEQKKSLKQIQVQIGKIGRRNNLNAVFEAVEFPASIADLNASLSDVNRNALSHFGILKQQRSEKAEKY
mgnify:CR=1 FL=1